VAGSVNHFNSLSNKITHLKAGPGRPKGSKNRIGGELKEMILLALEKAGGTNYLIAQAHENPKTFLLLLGRVLPLQVTGDAENPIQQVIRWASEREQTLDPSKRGTCKENEGDQSSVH
jgi:hypothetical protein